MLEASKRILSFTHGMNYYEFKEDFKTQDAVLRNLEVWEKPPIKYPKRPERIILICPGKNGSDVRSTHLSLFWGQH